MSPRRTIVASILGALVLGGPTPASAQTEAPAEDGDLIVLSGDIRIRRGEQANEVVVLHGSVIVAGVVRGDVVLVDGDIEVTGQVGGAVINAHGPVVLGPSAQVGGQVVAGGSVRSAPGAQVEGGVREDAIFAIPLPIGALGPFASWLAVWFSVLALGLLILLLAPRGADAVARAALGTTWPSAGWGALAFVALPILGGLAVITLVWLPLGLAVLLALFFLYSVGVALCAFGLGRRLWHDPRGRVLAFVFGWAILAAVAAIPFVGGVVWAASAAFGLGAGLIATWRARGAGGRHRPGGKMPLQREETRVDVGATTADGALVELEAGQEGVGL